MKTILTFARLGIAILGMKQHNAGHQLYLPMSHRLSALLVLCLLSGCTSFESKLQQGMATITPVQVKIEATDPIAVANQMIPSPGFWTKDQLETEGEYRDRMATVGVSGQETTFLIDPDSLEVSAYPDRGSYYIQAKDHFSVYLTSSSIPDERKNCITLREVITPVSDELYKTTVYMLKITNFDRVSYGMKWRVQDTQEFYLVGLPVMNADLAFRDKLKAKKITLGFRGNIGSAADARRLSESLATGSRHHPGTVFLQDIFIIPLTVTEVFVVDLDTNLTILGKKL